MASKKDLTAPKVMSKCQTAYAGGRAILARFSMCATNNADPYHSRVSALSEDIRKFENRARIAAGGLGWFAQTCANAVER